MADARFEDGAEAPLWLGAADAEDLKVLAALTQDAVLPITDMTFARGRREFALLINRFRWEDHDAATRAGRPPERVRSMMLVRDVRAVQSQGIDRNDRDTILSLLDLVWTPGADGTGRLELLLAGDGAIALEVESLDVTLRDVTRPYLAPAGKAPDHG
ncbi:DUF2948 family protein [Gemmobacter caeruleus]|uniref:DUF2948 family protein n=1 Tax=Gemmobacter caeruleus TaxID=2595004 RepID=UPI0011EBE33C|nr:DUF2948 family protein [Gemmobacter caeruleus]